MAGASKNLVVLIGRLTRDPDLRYTPNGNPVCNFSLAVDRKMSKAGDTDFIDCTAWRKLGELCNEFLHKGSLVCVEGSIQTRTYEKDGKNQKAFEVVAEDVTFLTPKGQGGGDGGQRSSGGGSRGQSRDRGHSQNDYGSNPDHLGEDDIPW